MKINCELEVFCIGSGEHSNDTCRMSNTTMYSGYDLLAAMVTSDKYINGMYI